MRMRLFLSLAPLLLAACGQAGDLYLPDKKPVPATTVLPSTAGDAPASPAAPAQPPASDAQQQTEQKKEIPKSP